MWYIWILSIWPSKHLQIQTNYDLNSNIVDIKIIIIIIIIIVIIIIAIITIILFVVVTIKIITEASDFSAM